MTAYRFLLALVVILGASERAVAGCVEANPGSFHAHCTTSVEAAAWPAAHLRPIGYYAPYCPSDRPPQYGSTYEHAAPYNRYVVYWQCGTPGTPDDKYGIASAATFDVDCPFGRLDVEGADPRCLRDPEEVDPDKDCDDKCPAGRNPSNPIQTALGTKTQDELDFSLPGGLTLVRTYSSRPVGPGAMGTNWRHNYQRALDVYARTNQGYLTVYARRPSGAKVWFRVELNGTITTEPDVTHRLMRILDANGTLTGWSLRNELNEIETYDASGRLQSIAIDGDASITFTYSGSRLISAKDADGRALSFHYGQNGKLTRATTPDGSDYLYEYNINGDLSSVIYPDQTPTVASDNPRRIYHYEYAG